MPVIEDDRQEEIIKEAQTFAASELKPYASQIDSKGVLPKKLIKKMADKNYLSATFPAKYGGLDLDPVYYGKLTECISKACSASRALLTVQTSLVGEVILRFGNQAQKEKWLPEVAKGTQIGAFGLTEPNAGSDAKNVQCKYENRKDHFIVNGPKKWISFGGIADFFIIIATNGAGISAFIVERDMDGVNSRPIAGLLAGRASHIAEIDLKDVVVPRKNLLGVEGSGFAYLAGTALDHGRYSVAWAGVGIAQAALEAMVSHSRKREQFGQKIHEFQLLQGMIGDAVTKTHAARALCLEAGELRKNKDPEAVHETTIAKYFASKVANDVSTDAVQVLGGMGCCNKSPVERLFREAKILEIIEGTSQIQQIIIAKYGLRKYHLPEV
jgi:hypothetical protein